MSGQKGHVIYQGKRACGMYGQKGYVRVGGTCGMPGQKGYVRVGGTCGMSG